jgi:predicted permease
METTLLVFSAVLPIFFVITSGVLARKLGWLDVATDRSLMNLVVNLLYPALIFNIILGNDALRQPSNLILPPLVGLTTVVGGFALAMLVARKFRIGNQKDCNTFAFTTGIYNYAYFPIPIIALLFDRETMGVLLVHNLGVEIAMWVLGVGFILSRNDPKSVWKRVFSGPVIAILIAVPMNYFKIDRHLPHFALETVNILGQCAIPLALILIGATFADLSQGVKLTNRLQIPLAASALRLAILPALFILTAFILPLSIELKAVIAVQAAMPCGVFPIVLARHFDGSPEVALKVVLGTTLLSLLTIPLWIGIGMKLLDL